MKKNKVKKRNNIKFSKIFIIIALFLFIAMIARLLELSLSDEIDNVNLKELASKRTSTTEVLSAKRGTIYDFRGDALAQNVTSYKLIAYLSPKRTTNKNNPQHVVDKEKTAEALSPILNIDKEEILRYLSKDVYQTEFGVNGKNLSEIVKSKIEDLDLPGLDFIESYKRYYPKGDFLSYTIGYAKNEISTDKNGNEEETIKGEMGIEKYYDKILSGEDGYVTYQKDLKGYKIAGSNEIRQEAVEGKNIYLTIDSSIQFYVEQSLKASKENFGFEWFTMVIADAKTGKILALSSSPSFDPNLRNMTNYLDLTIGSPFEPGSTMKTFTYMAAMENGVYDGDETYNSGVFTTTDGTEIGDWNRNGWGSITFDHGYALSSNVGIINLINRHMNSAMLRQYFRKLGFGTKTGITLSNESAGTINFKYETEIYNAGFGQGITTTPLQYIQALTPLTNDGMLLKPYIVDRIVDPNTKEVIYKGNKTEIERVASTTTVDKIKSLMNDTVNGIGNTGSGYRLESGQLIGKTGTSQIANENGGGYLSGQDDIISSFTGIYPKDNPEIIIYAAVKRPTGGNQKAISSAVKDVINNLSKYYGHDDTLSQQTEKITEYKLPSFINKKTSEVKETLTNNNITNQVILGNGDKIIKQYPSKSIKITNKEKVYLITNDSNIKVPNTIGLSSKEAKEVLMMLGLKVNLQGTGYVTEQSIQEGADITDNLEITLILAPKFVDS